MVPKDSDFKKIAFIIILVVKINGESVKKKEKQKSTAKFTLEEILTYKEQIYFQNLSFQSDSR